MKARGGVEVEPDFWFFDKLVTAYSKFSDWRPTRQIPPWRSRTVKLSAQGNPIVQGSSASLNVVIKTETETGASEKTVPFSFKKENDVWVIESGAL